MKKYIFFIISFIFAFMALLFKKISLYLPNEFLSTYFFSFSKLITIGLSQFFGIFPFSIFEITIYSLIIILISYISLTLFKCIKDFSTALPKIKWMILNLLSMTFIAYAAFVFLWGLNYSRPPLINELGLVLLEENPEELKALARLLTERTNYARENILTDKDDLFTTKQKKREVIQRAALGFEAIETKYPFLAGHYGPPKPILASSLMNYTFITGIYSPFTGEPNINIKTPELTLLFTTLHEIAHQRGIAQENEANFIAFLTSISHPDSDFQYAGYFNALGYVRAALREIDSECMTEFNSLLTQGVINDINYRSDFWSNYQGPLENTFQKMNESYLKANGVSEGNMNYGLVVDLLLSYYRNELVYYMK